MHARRRAPAPRTSVSRQRVAHEAHLPSWLGWAQRSFERVGWWPRLAMVRLAGLALPLLGLGGFQLQVGIDALVIALLAVGLNIVVGWAGLLDLGYVAFFGFGAYGFALLSSARSARTASTCQRLAVAADRDDRRRRSRAACRLAVAAAARRLPGDRHPVLRRGVRGIHQQRGARARFGGPNGIVGIDPIRGFGSSSPATRATTTCSSPWSSSPWRCCGCSRHRAPDAPGGPCARTRWRPRR